MKKYTLITMFCAFALTTLSCRERNPGQPTTNSEMEGVRESKEESMEKRKEWARSDEIEENTDSTAVDTIKKTSNDSTPGDSVKS
jgi:hypothetical protein